MLQTVGQKHLHIGRPEKVHTVLQPQLFNACGRDSGEPYIKRSFLFASRPSDFTSRVEAPRSQHKPSQSFELEQHRSIAHPTGPKTNTDPRRSIKCSRRALDTHTHLLRTVIVNSVVECILRAKTLPLHLTGMGQRRDPKNSRSYHRHSQRS